MSNELPIRIRPGTDSDTAFIMHSWVKNVYDSPRLNGEMPFGLYQKEQREVVKALIDDSLVCVVCHQDDPDQVYGFAVGKPYKDKLVMHFVYVKHQFRLNGIGKLLMQSFNYMDFPRRYCSYWAHYTLRVKFNLIYNPFEVNHVLAEVKDAV